MSEPKIAVIHPRFQDGFGGTYKVCLEAVKALENVGKADLYWGDQNSIEEARDIHGVELDESQVFEIEKPLYYSFLKKLPIFGQLEPLIHDTFFARLAKDIEEDYDAIIFTHHLRGDIDVFDVPVIQYLHKKVPEITVDGKVLPYRKLLEKFDLSVLDADMNLTNSNYVKNQLDLKAEVVYPPVHDFEEIEWEEREDSILLAGRISPDKNIEQAIDIASELDLKLVIAGLADEEYVQDLKNRISNNVEIRENLPSKEYKELFSKSKVGLSCKRGESFGITTAEYMRAGMMPMVRRGSGPEEIVQHDAFLYDSISEARRNIENILDDKEKSLKLVEKRSENFSTSQFRAEIKSIVQKLV